MLLPLFIKNNQGVNKMAKLARTSFWHVAWKFVGFSSNGWLDSIHPYERALQVAHGLPPRLFKRCCRISHGHLFRYLIGYCGLMGISFKKELIPNYFLKRNGLHPSILGFKESRLTLQQELFDDGRSYLTLVTP